MNRAKLDVNDVVIECVLKIVEFSVSHNIKLKIITHLLYLIITGTKLYSKQKFKNKIHYVDKR